MHYLVLANSASPNNTKEAPQLLTKVQSKHMHGPPNK